MNLKKVIKTNIQRIHINTTIEKKFQTNLQQHMFQAGGFQLFCRTQAQSGKKFYLGTLGTNPKKLPSYFRHKPKKNIQAFFKICTQFTLNKFIPYFKVYPSISICFAYKIMNLNTYIILASVISKPKTKSGNMLPSIDILK